MTKPGETYIGSLCTIAQIKEIAQISPNSDITDAEVGSYVDDATYAIREIYGDPFKKTTVQISYSSQGSTWYDFTGDTEPVYKLIEVRLDNREVVPSGSYTGSLETGFIDFNLSFLQNNESSYLQFRWIPKVFNLLAKNKAALWLLEDTKVYVGENIRNPLIAAIRRRVEMYENSLIPHYPISQNTIQYRDGEFIHQDHWFK